jgi:hypothetical protein
LWTLKNIIKSLKVATGPYTVVVDKGEKIRINTSEFQEKDKVHFVSQIKFSPDSPFSQIAPIS